MTPECSAARPLDALSRLTLQVMRVTSYPLLHADMNPDFYQGTAVEAPVGKLMADKRRTPATAAE